MMGPLLLILFLLLTHPPSCNSFDVSLFGFCTPIRYVRINSYVDAYLNFGEMRVLVGGVNIAKGKSASQSSTFADYTNVFCGGAMAQGPASASYAVDDDPCTFSCTVNTNPSWEVDLGSGYSPSSVEFINRQDGYRNRLNGARISLFDVNKATITTVTLPSSSVLSYTIGYCLCNKGYYCPPGSTSATQNPCPAGTFGSATGLITSACSGQCQQGYYCAAGSVSATQSSCPAGTFGSTVGLSTAACSGPCPVGHFCPSASTAPIPCPMGTYQSSLGSAVCVPCQVGYWGGATGLSTPTCSGPCIPGADCTSYSGSVTTRDSLVFFTGAVNGLGSPSPAPSQSTTARSSLTPLLGTLSVTASQYSTLSFASSASPSPSPSMSFSPLASPSTSTSPSDSSLATFSPTPTLSATQTPTATRTPPPFSCLSRVEGCITPSASFAPPVTEQGGLPVVGIVKTPPTSGVGPPPLHPAIVSWPGVVCPLTITFQLPPTLGEATNVTCVGDERTHVVRATPGQPSCLDTSSPTFPSCVSIPSSSSASTISSSLPLLTPVTAFFTVYPLPALFYDATTHLPPPPSQPLAGVLSCVVNSAPLAFSIYSQLPLPRYGTVSALQLPVTLYPLSYPLLAGIAMEGQGSNVGAFRGLSTPISPFTPLPLYFQLSQGCPAVFPLSLASNYAATSVWRSGSVVNCSAALTALWGLARREGEGGVIAPASLTPLPPGQSLPPLSASISGSRHLLLFSSTLTPFLPTLSVTLGGVPCTVNWVVQSGGGGGSVAAEYQGVGSIASVSTPTLAALCNASVSARGGGGGVGGGEVGGGCGSFPLIVSHYPLLSNSSTPSGFNATARASIFTPPSPYLPLPASYPPLIAYTNWTLPLTLDRAQYLGTQPPSLPTLSPWTQLGGLQGVLPDPSTTLRYYDQVVFTPPSGFFVTTICTDPTLASPDLCGVSGYTQPLLSQRQQQQQPQSQPQAGNSTAPSALVCAWGGGDVCQPCPSPGFLCPGGQQLLPLPGYWVPSVDALPGTTLPCPDPEANVRCPGYLSIPSGGGVYGCGVGYRGQACAACASRYYRSGGACAPCPSSGLGVSLVAPLALFVGALLVFGAVLVGGLSLYLKERGKHTHPGQYFYVSDVAHQVGQLLVWCWVAAQGLASIFALAQTTSPPFLAPLFRAVGALAFQGVTLDPVCYTTIPFLALWMSLGVVVLLYTLGFSSLLLLGWKGWGGGTGTDTGTAGGESGGEPGKKGAQSTTTTTTTTKALHAVLNLSFLSLTLAYGAITSVISSAIVCTPGAPMAVIEYLSASSSDGTSWRSSGLGGGAASYSDLKRAAIDPQFAASTGLSSLLRANIPVSVLSSDPYQVCGEGAHALARPIAIAFVLLFTLGFPLGGLGALYATGRLKGLRRAWASSSAVLFGCKKGQQGGGSSTNTSNPSLALLLLGSLVDGELLRSRQWVTFFEMLALAVITGCVSVCQGGGRLPLLTYAAAQGGVVAVCLCAVLLLYTLNGLHKAGVHWKGPVKMALYLVAAVTAAFNTTLVGLRGTLSSQPITRLCLSLVPLLLALCVAATLMVAWGKALPNNITWRHRDEGGVMGVEGEAGEGGAASTDPPPPPPLDFTTPNPMLDLEERKGKEEAAAAKAALLASQPWVRVKEEGGGGKGDEWFWFHAATLESQWTLPSGSHTECGWRHVGGEERCPWVHATGARRKHPPNPNLERDLLYLDEYRKQKEGRKCVAAPVLPEIEQEVQLKEGGEVEKEEVEEKEVEEEKVLDLPPPETAIQSEQPPILPLDDGIVRIHGLWRFARKKWKRDREKGEAPLY